jgi:hypothetical protein
MARAVIGGFVLGLTLYPFPCLVPGAFDGWSRWQYRGYSAGLLCLFAGWFAFVGWLIGR